MVPQMELSSAGIGHYKQIGNSMLVLLPSGVPGIKGAGTLDEMMAVVSGGRYLPGLVYEEAYYPLTIPARVGLASFDAIIPSQYDGFTRYLDLRNGGVLRWNKGFADDYGTAEVTSINDTAHLRYTSGGTVVNVDLNRTDIILKIIRENTGLMALDDLDFLNLLLMMGTCVTWMGGKMFEHGVTFLKYAMEKSGANAKAIEIAHAWDIHPKDICGRCWFPNPPFWTSFSLMDFAEIVGLKLEAARRDYFRPATKPITRRHWCAKEVPRLNMFKNHVQKPYVQGQTTNRPLSFYEMADLASMRDNLLAALGIERIDTATDFVVADYVRSMIPGSV